MQMFFDGWASLLRTLVVGIGAYVALIVLLRISGNRTLSKMNAFDFVVTVALGSTLATVLLSSNVALAEGVLAFAVLIGLQYAITWSSVRIPGVRSIVTGEPTLLLYRGEPLRDAMRRARIAESELHAALRAAGVSAGGEAAAVVLETDGSLSVVRSLADPRSSVVPSLERDRPP